MTGKRKRYAADFKAKVALEALRGELTTAQLATKHGVHQTMVLEAPGDGRSGVRFLGQAGGEKRRPGRGDRETARENRPVGGGTGFFGESLRSMSVDRRRELIEPVHRGLSIVRQCELVAVSRSTFYREPAPETALNLTLMRWWMSNSLEPPWYGSRQMARYLRRQGHTVGRERVRRLMAKMGLAAIYQRPRTTVPHPSHRIYPYLLREMTIDQPNQVWC